MLRQLKKKLKLKRRKLQWSKKCFNHDNYTIVIVIHYTIVIIYTIYRLFYNCQSDIIVSQFTPSMKSLTAAGKFKKRKYKEENQKRAVELSFLSKIVIILAVDSIGLISCLVWGVPGTGENNQLRKDEAYFRWNNIHRNSLHD